MHLSFKFTFLMPVGELLSAVYVLWSVLKMITRNVIHISLLIAWCISMHSRILEKRICQCFKMLRILRFPSETRTKLSFNAENSNPQI